MTTAPDHKQPTTIQSPPPVPPYGETVPPPDMGRRILAKVIDFIALGLLVVVISRATDVYFLGLLVGYGYLALADCGGSLGKGILGLEVRDYMTGRVCSPYASAIRNIPFVLSALPARLHQTMLGLERREYIQTHAGMSLLFALVGLAILVVIVVGASNSTARRHIGDQMAGTIVITRKKLGAAPPLRP